MRDIGTTSIAEGQKALAELIDEINQNGLDWNEAETRFHIIDRIIVNCLGWPREEIRLEQPQGRSYSDYELGLPRQSIWEAKKEKRTFDLPSKAQKSVTSDLSSILALGGEAAEAIKQVQEYCSRRGVQIAVAANGPQLIAFLATRTDGTAPLEGRCLVINGYKQLLEEFPRIWQVLSPSGIAEHRLIRLLSVGDDRAIPQKLSSHLISYPHYRYPSELQASLRTISELLLIDLIDQPEVEKQFFRECYCESGALSQHALISKKMLATRYASLFSLSEKSPNAVPVIGGPGKPFLTPEVLAEAISQRPVILIGDVGVGKTSFLKHLVYVSAFEEFQEALYIYIDLGSKGALASNLNDFVLNEVEHQLQDKYNVDIYENAFVSGVYHQDIKRFEQGIYQGIKINNPALYDEKFLSFIESKTQQRDQHLKKSIAHIAHGRRKQLIVMLDNADQRDYTIQQESFIIAQNLAKDWHAAVFIAVRPQTFYRSKQSGALTAYPNRVFTISPPRVDLVIERRLNFALSLAEGRIVTERLKNIKFDLVNIADFIKALLLSLKQSTELVEFLSNITGGNIRAVIDFVTKFIGSANVDAEKIIRIMTEEKQYIVPLHEFWKAALLGDFSYYDPMSSLALNLFDIFGTNQNEHFLLPMILSYISTDGKQKSKEGFVATDHIIIEMQDWGFSRTVTEMVIRRANNKKLIDTPQRVTFDEDEAGLYGDMPDSIRISTIGAYHIKRWITEFSYLDAMSYDTPIFDEEIRNSIRKNINSFFITDRYDRALEFRSYLTKVWSCSNLNPIYFDWLTSLELGQGSFDKVQRAIHRHFGQQRKGE